MTTEGFAVTKHHRVLLSKSLANAALRLRVLNHWQEHLLLQIHFRLQLHYPHQQHGQHQQLQQQHRRVRGPVQRRRLQQH